MVIVDSTVWIDYLHGIENRESLWLDGNLQRQRLGIIDLILCEVLQGIRNDGDFARVQRELSGLQMFDTGGAASAWLYGSQHDRLPDRDALLAGRA